MKTKFRIFPMMILTIVIVFGLKSYDFAMGLDAQKNDVTVANMLNSIDTASGQEEDVTGEIAQPDQSDVDFSQSNLPYSGQEIQLLQRLSERREELDQRERDMDVREKLLVVTENGIDKKISSLKSIEEQIKALIEIHGEQEAAQLDSLVKTYSAMKPKDAAKIFDTLNMEVLISIIERMKPKTIANVLAKMKTVSANEITVELATRKKLPNIEG